MCEFDMIEYKHQTDIKHSKVCKTCNKLFYKTKCSSFKVWKTRKFCSLSCRRPDTKINLLKRKFIKLNYEIKLICKNCQKDFYVKTMSAYKQRKFCSITCSSVYNQTNNNYWDLDKERKENLYKTQKEKVKNDTWVNPILVRGALEKMKKTKAKYPTIFSKERIELASKIAANRLVEGKNPNLGCYKYGKLGYFFSVKNNYKLKYRSSFEKKAFELLEKDKSVLSYQVEPFSINYIIDNKKRYYVPDILITYIDGIKRLIEIKPIDKLLTKDTIIKKKYAEEYCKYNNILGGYEIWSETILFSNRNL